MKASFPAHPISVEKLYNTTRNDLKHPTLERQSLCLNWQQTKWVQRHIIKLHNEVSSHCCLLLLRDFCLGGRRGLRKWAFQKKERGVGEYEKWAISRTSCARYQSPKQITNIIVLPRVEIHTKVFLRNGRGKKEKWSPCVVCVCVCC